MWLIALADASTSELKTLRPVLIPVVVGHKTMIGLRRHTVQVVEHDPRWVALAADAELARPLPDLDKLKS